MAVLYGSGAAAANTQLFQKESRRCNTCGFLDYCEAPQKIVQNPRFAGIRLGERVRLRIDAAGALTAG
ncbi:hypothetical protein E4J93_05665 [Collinsella sp. BA40]|nr:hypothetical protein E4J93_05665 [Collinsella sp. BA40]